MRKQLSGGGFRILLSLFVLSVTVGIFLRYSETASSQHAERASGVPDGNAPIVSQAVGFAVSQAVRDLPEVVDPKFELDPDRAAKAAAKRAKQEEKIKNPFNAKTIKNAVPGAGAAASNYAFRDEALPDAPAAPSVVPTPGVSFDGLSSQDNQTTFGTTFAPPDTVGDVGPNHYVQMTNTLVRIFNKNGTPASAPFLLSSLTNVLGGPCVNTDDGDPIVNYDPLANRWILSQFCAGPVPGHQMFAVSTTPDPTGSYYVYDFVNPSSSFFDYPHVGVWPDGYYMTVNQFNQAGTAFLGAGVFAYDRVKMLQGDPTASYIYFDQFGSICPTCGGQLPTDLDGTVTPPAGMGNLIMEYTADEFGDTADGLRIFEFKPNFATPASSTFTPLTPDLSFAAFDSRNPTGRTDIEQAGSATNLDSIADRLMFRVAYRNLGTVASPVNSWVMNFTVNVGGATPTSAATYQAGIRWAEIRRAGANGAFSVANQGTQATNPGTPAGGTNSWMGSIAQDKDGNILLGYSTSGSAIATDFPSLKYAGRQATDPANTFQAQVDGFLGTGFQAGAGSRWGDYSAMSVDPVDECSFWYTQEYRSAASNGNAFLWNTRVLGNIKFPTCTAPARGTISGTITACASGLPVANAVVTLPGGFLATTNATGQYTIINVPAGTTSVSATKSGGFNVASSNNVVVTGGSTTTANLCLTGVPVLAPGAVTLVSESCLPANGVVDPGETVTVSLPVLNTGGANTTADVGTLQATGGVVSPSGAQSYGAISAGGAAVSRNFTFTANPLLTCGTNITATVAHQDGASSLGNVVYTIPTGATGAASTRSYTGPAVAVPDNVPAGVNIPLAVSGFSGTVADLNFRFESDPAGTCNATVGNTAAAMDHTFIGDLIFKLTSPAGTTVTIMNGRGGTRENICTTTLDDDGGFPSLSTVTSTAGQFLSGNFAPDNPLSAFDGQNPNGTWTLNVSDNAGIDTGSMRRFSLVITPKTCTLCAGVPTPSPTPTVVPTPTPTPSPSPTPTPGVTPTPGSGCVTQTLIDPSLEASVTGATAITNPNWPSTSTNFESSLCSVAFCGASGPPRTGTFLAWFGGIAAAESGSLQQTRVIPVGTNPVLKYWMRVSAVAAPFDATLVVKIDGTTVQTVTEPATAEAAYTERTVALPAGVANGASHVIRFEYTNSAASGTSNFLVDDITLETTTAGACVPTPTPTPTPSPSPSPTPVGGLAVSYTGPAVSIPDNSTAGVSIPLVVGSTCNVTDLNFRFDGTQSATVGDTGVGVTHSWVGDLTFRLTSPSGTAVTFFDRPGVPASAAGCNNNNLAQLILDDDGGLPSIEGQCNAAGSVAAFPTGSFAPNNPLSAFDGQSATGTWTLFVTDGAGADTGTVNRFSLVFTCATGGTTPTPTPTPSPTPTTFVAFGSTTYKQDESQSIDITINRTGVTTGGTTAFLTMTSTRAVIGTAGCGTGADVVNITPGPINFNAGETSKTITLGLCGDVSADTDETVNLTLTGLTSGTGASNTAVLTINDTANQFKNAAAISINNGTTGGLYPSPIVVSGATNNAFRIRVTLYDYYTTLPDNLDVLLVGPNGAKYALVGDVGGPNPITEAGAVTLTLADYPNAVLPDAGPLATGIFKPTTCETPVTNFPAPAPAGPYVEPGCVVARTNAQTLFGNFGGSTANGTWNLYVRDDGGVARPDAPEFLRGEIKGGWGIELLPSTAAGVEISGRVLTPDGRGLRNATVTITDSMGNRRTAITSSFGYYHFADVEAGGTYTVGVSARRYRFTPRILPVQDTLTDVDFVGQE